MKYLGINAVVISSDAKNNEEITEEKAAEFIERFSALCKDLNVTAHGDIARLEYDGKIISGQENNHD